jgi:N-acetyl-gamma-glutamyl-phosphate reductase
MRGAFTRGILAACYQKIDASEQEIKEWFMAYYLDAPFVHLSEEPISVKQVVNTNKALIHLEKVENQVLVTVAIDNLLKGASGQAVQNMNIMMGWDERMGLLLKPSVF